MRNRLLGSSIGYFAAALAATAALAAGCGSSGTRAADGPSTAPISLPDRLGSFENPITVAQRLHARAAAIAGQRRLYRDAARLTTAAYSRAYDGAAVATRFYVDTAEQNQVGVIAVRSGSPGLTTGVVFNPADLGLAVNQREVHVYGDVACVVDASDFVAAGGRVDPSTLYYSQCQRTGPGLTVTVFSSNLHGDTGRQEAVALTDSAYRAVAGG